MIADAGCEREARRARLRYVLDDDAWLRRERGPGGFVYVDASGRPAPDEAVERATRLRIPPAWRGVRICPLPDGHLQAVGRDARGRKQYRYHPAWVELRQQDKFATLAAFGRALPALRARRDRDLDIPELRREKVLATIVWLLEHTLVRIGNTEYAEDNESYGLTTLRDRHVRFLGRRQAELVFTGKSGVKHEVCVEDPRVVRIIRQCFEIPGYELFQYRDAGGTRHIVHSGDVNEYVSDAAGADVTAKDFRTWGGTRLSSIILYTAPEPETEREARQAVVDAVKAVAEHLRNKPATCRKFYIHPTVIDCYRAKTLKPRFDKAVAEATSDACAGLRPREYALVRLLEG